MKYAVIEWKGKLCILAKGEISRDDIEAIVDEAVEDDPVPYTIGEQLRYRQWPGQWHTHYDLNKSESTRGAFLGRLIHVRQR